MTLFFRFLRPRLVTISTVTLCLVQIASLRGQMVQINPLSGRERVRTAAQQLEIESFRNPEAFFRIGPTEEVLIGSVGVNYTDNANLTPTNKVSDLSFDQSLTLNATWVISHLNQLRFNFAGSLTENFYSKGSNQVTFAIAPGSLLQFQFALSDVQVRLYDHFANVQNPTTDPTATDTANLNSFTNTVGAVVDKDLSLAVLTLFVDYTYNNQSGTNVAGQGNPSTTGIRNSYRVGSSVYFNPTPEIFYGIETTATQSNGSHTANVDNVNVGPFIRGKLSPLTDFNLAGGASLYDTSAPAVQPTTYYFSGVIRHQLNRNTQLIFSALHDFVFTTSTNLVEETIFRVGTQLNLTRFFTFTAGPFVDIGKAKTGSFGRFTQFGAGASLGWKPHKRWSANLSYNYIRLEADLAANTYIQNSLSFSVSYAF